MRKLILAVSLIGLAVPAAAQPRHDPRYDDPVARELPRAYEIDRMGDAVARVADALLDIDIGPVADAVDPARRYDGRRHSRTLEDLARRDDPYVRQRVRASIGAATYGAGAAAEEIAAVTPVLRRSFEDAARRVDAAMAEARYRHHRDYDRRYRDDYPDDYYGR